MKKILSLATLLFLGLMPAAHAETIKIGLMAPLTGAFASEGQDMQKMVEMQVEEANKAGGINGNLIELVVEDDGSIPRSAANAANRLVSKDVQFIIGTYGSSITEASQDIYDEAGALQIATGSTAIRLTEKGYERFFRTCPRDDEQGRVAADALAKMGYKNVALLHDNSAYAKGLAEEIKSILDADERVSIVFYDALQPGERDYMAILTKIKGISPDVIMFTGYYPEAGMLLRQKAEMKWDVPVIGGDAANHPDLVKIAGTNAAKGYRCITPPLPEDLKSEASIQFLDAYKAKYGAVPSSIWSMVTGDAFNALVKGIQEKGTNPDAVAGYLHSLENFESFTGTFGFNKKGDRVGDLYRLYEVDENGAFILQEK